LGYIGNIYKSDLVLPATLKSTFKDIRNHLAGNTKGITRRSRFSFGDNEYFVLQIYDEQDKGPDDKNDFLRRKTEESQ